MTRFAEGTLEKSGIRFQVFVSEPVDPDDMRAIANLLYAGADKYELEQRGGFTSKSPTETP